MDLSCVPSNAERIITGITGGNKMKNYTITVNGVAYDVTVEEKGAGAARLQQLR